MTDWRRTQVDRVLDQLRPWIKSDGGNVSVVDVSDDGVVTVRFEGNCVGCGAQGVTVDEGIRATLTSQLDWVTDVVAVQEGEKAPGPSVSARLRSDFAPTEELLVALDEAVLDMQAGSPLPPAVGAWLEHAATRLEMLLRREEDCVFPVVVDFLGAAEAPVGLMRHEHGEIRNLQRAFAEAAGRYDAAQPQTRADLRAAARALAKQLSGHLIKERTSVLVLLDRDLGDDLRAELLQDLGRFEAEAARRK
ncbi:MAG: NifU family protein [Planctomycetes bacterium]|nr:NifU family protein [Planctomycetota bacterium]